jgi:FkbM family methyltransferase
MIRSLFNWAADTVSGYPSVKGACAYFCRRMSGFQYGSYSLADEAALAISFVKNLTRSGVIVDAGANHGRYSEELLKSKFALDRLIMIEPQSTLRGQLIRLVNEYHFVVLEQVAVGSTSGETQLFSDSEGSGLASLYERDIRHVGLAFNATEPVQVVTLESIASKYGLQHIDYLKLDLEGHELEVLKGAKELLEGNRIRAITFEFGGCNIDSRTYMKDFWNLLVNGYGYSFYRLLPRRRLLKINSYSESLERFDWQNILATAPGVEPSWKILH